VLHSWLQPLTFGARINEAVGFPWEIIRTNNLSPRRTVDIYSKDGGIPGYSSRFSLLPSYGLGAVILTAGDMPGGPLLPALSEAVFAALFPALEDATRAEAVDVGYTGRFSAGNDSWIKLGMDNGPGLVVEGWYSRGINFLESLQILYGSGTEKWRAYPAEVFNEQSEEWRLVLELPDLPAKGLGSRGVWDADCHSWQIIAVTQYAGQAVDKLAFRKKDGKVFAIEASALRTVLKKE
jgi:hypothetical protein